MTVEQGNTTTDMINTEPNDYEEMLTNSFIEEPTAEATENKVEEKPSDIQKFTYNNKDYYAVTDNENIDFYTSDFFHINNKGNHEFFKNVYPNSDKIPLDDSEKEQLKEILNKAKEIPSKKMRKPLFNTTKSELHDNNFIPGTILEISVKDKDSKDQSKAYFKIDDNYILRKVTSTNYRSNGSISQIANASSLNNISAFNFLDKTNSRINSIIKSRYFASNNKSQMNDEDIEQINKIQFEFKFKDVTNQFNKDIENGTKKKSDQNNELPKLTTFDEVPDFINEMLKKKHKELTPEQYTESMFNMTKKLYEIPYEDRNISDYNKKLIIPLMKMYKNTDQSQEELRKAFNQYMFDHKNQLIQFGNLYAETHTPGYSGYKRYHSDYSTNQRDTYLKAIQEDKYPIMTAKNAPDYIYNPENMQLYKGNDMICLQTNNALNNLDAQAYVPVNSYNKIGGQVPREFRTSCRFVSRGTDSRGRAVYDVVVPVKPTRREKKMQKLQAKEELRRNIFDAKFNYKFNQLPTFYTQLQPIPEKQPPLAPSTFTSTLGELPKEANIEDRINYDTKALYIASLTKTPYVPATNWTAEPFKSELLNYVGNNIEKVRVANNNIYNSLSTEIKNTNNRINQNIQTVEKKNENKIERKGKHR